MRVTIPTLLNLSLVLFPQQPVWTEHDVCSFWNLIGLVLRYDSDTCHTGRVMSPKKKFLSGDLGSFLVCSHEFKWLNVFLFTYVSMWHFLKTDGVSNDTENKQKISVTDHLNYIWVTDTHDGLWRDWNSSVSVVGSDSTTFKSPMDMTIFDVIETTVFLW